MFQSTQYFEIFVPSNVESRFYLISKILIITDLLKKYKSQTTGAGNVYFMTLLKARIERIF